MKQILLALIAIALLASCRSSRTIGRAVGRKDSTTVVKTVVVDTVKSDTQRLVQTAMQELQKNRIDFTTFTAKLDVDYKGTDGKSNDVNANIRMYKDSAIWISLNATLLSIEGLRLMITKDSVKLLNKLEKTYAARGIGFLQETTSLPLNLYILQDLIIGNPVYLDSNITRYSSGNGVISFLSLGTFFKNLVTLNETDKSILHSKLTDTDLFRNRTADLTYENYENKKGVPFSTKRQIVVSERGRLEVKLNFKNYTFNEEVSFPFPVPKNYKHE
ncbi:MAG TPA: DUF4292 domain-containing protein [Flavisolibacter sp.]|nr:DUF4292 domain-containing protein [Flavisolibacter sp.]